MLSQKRAKQARKAEAAKKPVRKSVLRIVIDTFKGAVKEVRK